MSPSPASTLAVRLPVCGIFVALLLSAVSPLASLSPPVMERSLLVPRFEVDTTSGTGTTTLIALRNPTDERTFVSVGYFTEDDILQTGEDRDLEPHEVWTVNLRDVDGLQVDDDGFARGWLNIYAAGSSTKFDRVIVGDWFQVDVEQGFATADEIPRVEVCRTSSLRFLDFGDGMELTVFVAAGSVTVEVFDETGAPVGEPRRVETTSVSSELRLSDLTSERFGTLVFDFSATGSGTVFGRYRAEGRFSVSLPAVCEDDDSRKLSPPPAQTTLFLPRYTVDTRSAAGETTLLAVRNTADEPVTANIFFVPAEDPLAAFGGQVELAPRQVHTLNLRDLDGLPADGEGIARGSVTVEAFGPSTDRPLVAADALQVDRAGDFATGELLHQASELCERASIRFVDFPGPKGSGARFVIWLRRPPREPFAPAFTVRTTDEAGRPVGEPYSVAASDQVMEMSLAQITTARFGSLAFDFTASEGGLVLGRYSAEGRFSVALGSVCDESP